MICFIVGPDGADQRIQALTKLAGRLGHAPTAAASLDALRADPRYAEAPRALVLVPDLSGGTQAQDAIRFASEEQGRAFVVWVADALAPDLYKGLVRTRSGEWIGWGTGAQELADLTATLTGAEAAERGARVVSLLPSKGGVGNTTLALECALHLATRRKRGTARVAVLDLNVQGGTLADALDVEPRFDLGALIERPERLDEQLIDVFTSRFNARLDVFAPPARALRLDEVPPQIVFTVLDAVAKRYETILIDLPPVWLPWIDNILQGSDAVVVTGAATVPALRRLTGRLAALDALPVPASRLAVAVNLCEADLLGRFERAAEIDRALSGRALFRIRRDTATACGALDAGRPLLEAAPNARVSRDIRRLADWIATAAEQP